MARPQTLPRGGVWVMSPIGAVQVGAPADTLKDTLPKKNGVPRVVILPKQLVDVRRGVALGDLEFPIYWNLFAQKRPLIVVGTADQKERVLAAMQEALLGPLEQKLDDDVAPGHPVPDLAREHGWFRRGSAYRTGRLELDDAIDFRVIDEGAAVRIVDGAHVVDIELVGDGFDLAFDGQPVCRLPRTPPNVERNTGQMTITDEEINPADIAAALARARAQRFVPPRFGVTVLGRSHGFDPDPKERTTGFVLWIDGRGVLVDPPIDATRLLNDADIDADLVDGLILTHVHGDHDAGTLQKALAAGRITLWTTTSIFNSWVRKWRALSNVPEAQLRSLFDFRPVRVGAPVEIHGARLLFRFTLHSIPAVGFEAHYLGASFNYSGDTLNDPAAVDTIHAAGCMDDARREALAHYDWSHDLHFHESGIPPLHTPLDRLDNLDDDVKRRLRVLHVTPDRLHAHPGLVVAEPGRAATITLPVELPPEQRLLRNLSLLGHTTLFADLPLARAAELLSGAKEHRVAAGARLIIEGDVGDALYLVTAGKASVQRQGRELKVYGLGDIFGETAVFLRRPRNADVVALTDLEVLQIDGDVARRCCALTPIPDLVARHDRVRQLDPWSLVDDSSIFFGLTTRQRSLLETLLVPFEIGAGHRLLFADVVADRLPIVISGRAVLCDGAHDADDAPAVFVGAGGLIGDPAALLEGRSQNVGAVANGPVVGCAIDRLGLAHFLERNPGLRARVQPWTAAEAVSTADGMALMVTEHLS
ncbi:MAG TPA: cyclic nucleotide-binding domain-containing protein [Myxococcota bacterium]